MAHTAFLWGTWYSVGTLKTTVISGAALSVLSCGFFNVLLNRFNGQLVLCEGTINISCQGNENSVSALRFPHPGPRLESTVTVGGLGDPVLPPAGDFGEARVLALHAVPRTDSGWRSLKCNTRRGSSG